MRSGTIVCAAGLLVGLCSGAPAALTVKAIAAGAGYSLALASDGTVWTWGQAPMQVSGLTGVAAIAAGGSCHNLALKSDGSVWEWVVFARSTPSQVSGLSGVVAVADGGAHSLALKSDGTVWAWGDNSWGQLGDGTARSRTTPAQVNGLAGVVAIAAGQAHSLAVKGDGTVWAWGHNWYGQLGDGTTGNVQPTAAQVSGLTGVAAVSAGYGHSLALKRDGTIWAWGHNGAGQLGDGTRDNVRPTPAQVSGLTGVAAIAAAGYGSQAVKNDGTVWAWPGPSQLTPVQVNGLSGVVAVAAGLALKADGTVWTWEGAPGDGATAIQVAPGQIGELTGVAAVAASFHGGLALNRDGTVWQWGSRSTPIQVSGLTGVVAIAECLDHDLALKGDGSVWEWSSQSAPSQVSDLTGVVGIAANETRSLAVKSDGTVWEWSGQVWEWSGGSTPVQVSGLSGVVAVSAAFEWWWGELVDARSLALKSDRTVWVWAEGEWVRSPTPVQVSGLDGIVAIAGGEISLALRGDGTVWEWDEAAAVRPAPVQVNGLSGVVAVAVGASADFGTVAPHRLALKRDGTIWAWGYNGRGQLGDGTTARRGTPVQVAALSGVAGISAAGYHSLAVTSEGTVWEWGLLGDGTTRSTPVQVIQPGSPDLVIAMSHDGAFTAGEQGVYVLTITNTGLTAATGATTVTDTLPPGLSYVAATGAGWSCSGVDQIVTCTNPGPINPGTSSTIRLTVRVEPQAWPGVTNLATVTNASDRNLANNTIGDPTVVSLGQK